MASDGEDRNTNEYHLFLGFPASRQLERLTLPNT